MMLLWPSLSFLFLLIARGGNSSLLYSQEQVDAITRQYDETIKKLRSKIELAGLGGNAATAPLPPPLHRVRGVISLPGNKNLKISHSILRNVEQGDWSVSYWLKILSLNDDNIVSNNSSDVPIQTLLYKGNALDSYTPTCYLEASKSSSADGMKAHFARVVFKVNSDTFADRYIDPGVVKINTWQLYTFTFTNSSQTNNFNNSSDGDDIAYTMTLYIDTEVRIRVDYRLPVLANTEPLLLFQSGHFEKGVARALAHEIAVHGTTLSSDQIGRLYFEGLIKGRDAIAADVALEVVGMGTTHSSPLSPSLSVDIDGSSPPHTNNGGGLSGDAKTQTLLSLARNSSANCDSIDKRSALYADAAIAGSAEGLRVWAMLSLHGYEGGEAHMCGLRASEQKQPSSSSSLLSPLWGKSFYPSSASAVTKLNLAPLLALFEAADRGCTAALVPLSAYLAAGVLSAELISTMLRMHRELRALLPIHDNNNNMDGDRAEFAPPHTLLRMQQQLSSGVVSKGALSVGLIFAAAASGASDAFIILADKYHRGDVIANIDRDVETALYYAIDAANVASELFNRAGNQPIVQSDLLDDDTEMQVEKGNRGDSDELILTQRLQADEGHVPSMLNTADLLYYGGRGVARDQRAALEYYHRAAAAGDPMGMCGAAAMLIKGEGGPRNATAAIDLYSRAADMGSVKARNGLGYLYFYGDAVNDIAANKTLAFDLFMAAAATRQDADSLLNAGQCLEWGWGTDKNLSHALELYFLSARLFGNFNAVMNLARLHTEGPSGVLNRSAGEALDYYMTCARVGPSSLWVRRGLDQYLHGQLSRALSCYLLYASVYDVGASNAEFILRRRKAALLAEKKLFAHPSQPPAAHVAVLSSLASRGDAAALFHLGSANYRGEGVARSSQAAAAYYEQAAAKGQPLAAVYLGVMNQFGLGGLEESAERASAYYSQAQRSLDSLASGAQLRALVVALQAMQGGGVAVAYAARPLLAMAVRQLWDI